jgi:phosphoribosylamine--glycine ligase
MKVLVVGSGGREHAIADTLAQSKSIRKLFVAPGNGGMRSIAELLPIAADDLTALLEFANRERIDLTVIGPEVPLSHGIVDLFQKAGRPIVGPTADQARLESSKSFAKRFFQTNRIPTAQFQECATFENALRAVQQSRMPVVIKADGLAAGKGVTIAETLPAAEETLRQLMVQKSLGDAGRKVVIEEFLAGEEASFMVFADGTDFQPMVVAQDHKRRHNGDTGPNTGGMGAYSVDSILSPELRQRVVESIVRPTLKAAKFYSGILYAGLMLTTAGPKIIEYNVRFGDPETQVVLPRLKTDLLQVFLDIAEHRLGARKLEWLPDATATIVLVAGNYPGRVETGKRISGLDEASRVPDVKVYHAATRYEDGHYYTAGGRVLNVTSRGSSLNEALDRAYSVAELITFEGKDYRTDIGKKGLAKPL